MQTKITPPLKWHGGKSYLASRIISLFPPRCKNPNAPSKDDTGFLHYCEPYFGGGAVLLANNPEGISEVANDLNKDLTSFWCAIKHDQLFQQFVRIVEGTPFSQWEFDGSRLDTRWLEHVAATLNEETHDACTVAAAVKFFVHCRQSLSGRFDTFASITRNRTRRGMNEQVSAWLNTVEGLPAVHARLKRVLILNKPALEVIRKENGPRTLFYLDPPYLHETRATTGEYGLNEMTVDDHSDLLHALEKVNGRFLLSGYRSGLYDDYAKANDWNRHDFDLPNNAAGGKDKRRMTECVWCNF